MSNDNVYREAALNWINDNTTLDTSLEPLPASVELFIERYEAVMSMRPGVTSESISGLSQSFNTDVTSILKQYASVLLGEEYMKSDVKALPAQDRWVY